MATMKESKRFCRSYTVFRCLSLFVVLAGLLFQGGPSLGQEFKASHLSEIDEINRVIQERGARWVAGETSFSILSDEEKQKRLGLIKPRLAEMALMAGEETLLSRQGAVTLSPSLDWRNNGGNYVTPIRDQGGCGSCWAFGTTAALEAYTLIRTNSPGTDLNLSEQVMVSCGNSGSCGGGYISYASSFIRDTGLPVETCYPYTATNGTCSSACPNWQSSTNKITKWSYVANPYQLPATVDRLKNGLATYGPLVTTIDVYTDFDHYRSGVYSLTPGQSYRGGHAILLVGYNDPGQYFICKNSWGTWWGESGYFNIAYSEVDRCLSENNTTKCTNFGDWTIAYGDPVPSNQETVSGPTTLSGTTSGTPGTSYSYSTSGAVSSTGHPVQYFFEWGDGSNSDWLPVGTSSASKSWSSAGTYPVKSQARCSTDTALTSAWSGSVGVTIACATPGAPSSPSPSNGATGVSTSPTLSWAASSNASSYDIYFGTSSNPPLVGNTTSTSYGRSGLSYSTPYYWKIVAKNSCGSTEGSVWSFATAGYISMNILQPNGGETIPVGSSYTIAWGAPTQASKFKLHYSINNGATWKLIAGDVIGTSYSWKVPLLKNTQIRCRVRVIGYDSKGVKVGEDRSDSTFTIQGVRVTSPREGLALTSGTTGTITWETIGTVGAVQDTQIYCSKNGGTSWRLITTVPGNLGSYGWSVPAASTATCKVKVVLRDSKRNTLTTGISDGYFTIQTPPM